MAADSRMVAINNQVAELRAELEQHRGALELAELYRSALAELLEAAVNYRTLWRQSNYGPVLAKLIMAEIKSQQLLKTI